MTDKEHFAAFSTAYLKPQRYEAEGRKRFFMSWHDDFEAEDVARSNINRLVQGWDSVFLLARWTGGGDNAVVVLGSPHEKIRLEFRQAILTARVSLAGIEVVVPYFNERLRREWGISAAVPQRLDLGYSRFARSAELLESTLRILLEADESTTWVETRPTRFVASERLVSFVERGIQSIQEAAAEGQTETPDLSVSEKLKLEELRETISVRLERMLSTLGKRARQEGRTQLPISDGGRFKLPVQYEILDRLPIRPDEGGDFFSHLYSEIVSFLRAGGHFGGAWGEVIERANDLSLKIRPVAEIADESWEPAGDLEGDVHPET